jgi:peptidoglycan/xylan/chitin deacetylase (PgdA/CDA1 family)
MDKKRRSDWLTFLLAMLLLLSSALPWAVYGWSCFSQKKAVTAAALEEAKLIALTFDDGPRRSTTTALLDGLSQRGVHATFFLVGANVEVNQELVLRMDQEGHQISVHSYHHKLLTELSSADFYEEVGALRSLIADIVGYEDNLVLRPPYGKADASVKNLAGSPIIQWSIDPEDWSDTDTARQVEHIVSRAQDGDIILLHDIYPSSVETALQVVDALLAEGFYVVTIDELFAAKGIPLEDGQVYTCARD